MGITLHISEVKNLYLGALILLLLISLLKFYAASV